MAEHVILFTGPMGAGKTTAIQSLSEIDVVRTEANNSERHIVDKATTTVALDYGEILIGAQEKVRLYGIPGQKRFDFMWQILVRDAIGVVILIDNSQPDAMSHLDEFLISLEGYLRDVACVIGVGRTETHPMPSIDAFAARLAFHGHVFPVIDVDVRRRGDVLMLVELLLTQAEARLMLERP